MQRRSKRRLYHINIVPLVDVLIVLIFFFLMTVQFHDKNVLNITPPKLETAGKNKATEEIIIGVDVEGVFYYNFEPVKEAELEDLLKIASSVSEDQRILVIADEEVAFKNVTYVMDQCRKAGLEAIRIQTR